MSVWYIYHNGTTISTVDLIIVLKPKFLAFYLLILNIRNEIFGLHLKFFG